MKTRLATFIVICIILRTISSSYGNNYIAVAPPADSVITVQQTPKTQPITHKRTPRSNLTIGAKASLVVDAKTGEVIYAKNQDIRTPIASLTKLVTAMVYLETRPDLSQPVTIQQDDMPPKGGRKLRVGETITADQCLHMCLMSSDNGAAITLSRLGGMDRSKFIERMNELAYQMNLKQTSFVEASGLNESNQSSAHDYLKLMQRALANRKIAEITSKKNYQFKASNMRRFHNLRNTNKLLGSEWRIVGGKTGFINESGYCLALDAFDETGRRVNAVILGAPSSGYRYRDAKKLLTYSGRNQTFGN